jgi:hypothetical protein
VNISFVPNDKKIRENEMKKMENKLGSRYNILRIVIVVGNRAAADVTFTDA